MNEPRPPAHFFLLPHQLCYLDNWQIVRATRITKHLHGIVNPYSVLSGCPANTRAPISENAQLNKVPNYLFSSDEYAGLTQLWYLATK